DRDCVSASLRWLIEMWARQLTRALLLALLFAMCGQRAVGAGNGAGLQSDNGAGQDDGEGVRGRKVATDTGTQAKEEPKAAAESSKAEQESGPTSRGLKKLGRGFLEDQKQIWTSPARLRISDADWLVPVGGFAAGLFATDREVGLHLSNDPSTIRHYKT